MMIIIIVLFRIITYICICKLSSASKHRINLNSIKIL